MSPRTQLVLLLIASVLAPAAATAAAACPVSPSSGAISCYVGATFASMPTTGGLCTCTCGASAAVADSDYSNAPQDVTKAYVASSSACTSAYCTSTFATKCGGVYVNAAYTAGAAAVQAALSAGLSNGGGVPASVSAGAGAICTTVVKPCFTSGTGLVKVSCLQGMTSGSVTTYDALKGGATATSQCSMGVIGAALLPGLSVDVCNTNNWCARGTAWLACLQQGLLPLLRC
jgi:hypothetical protein